MNQRLMLHEVMKMYPYNTFIKSDVLKQMSKFKFPRMNLLNKGIRMTEDELDYLLNYDYLYDRYVVKNMSTTDICKEFDDIFDPCSIIRRLQKLGIPKRTRKEINDQISSKLSTKDAQEKRKATCILKYGTDHALKSDIIKHKAKTTCVNRYGVDNVAKSQQSKDRYRNTCIERYGTENIAQYEPIKKRIRETNIKRFGTSCVLNNPEVRKKVIATMTKNGSGTSNISRKLFDAISNSFPDKEFNYAGHGIETCIKNEETHGHYFLDFSYVDSNVKLAIEFNGDYWHCNPKLTAPDTKVSFFKDGTGTASDVWKFDDQRRNVIKNHGFKLLTVWEYDYVHNPDETVNRCLNFIRESIGTNQ